MCNLAMIDKIVSEARMVQLFIAEFSNDPLAIGHISFMLQQEVERALKVYLEFVGVTVPKTHDIERLVNMSRSNGSKAIITDWLVEHAASITRWETLGRYDAEFTLELAKLREVSNGVFSFLYANGFSKKLFSEITDDVKMEISRRTGRDLTGASCAAYNVLYLVYIKPAEKVVKPPRPKTLDTYFEKYSITNKALELDRLKELYETDDVAVILDKVYTDFM